MVATPAEAAEARRAGKLIVLLAGTLHGGEVDGKEALLQLAREAAMLALREEMEKVEMNHFKEALKKVRPSVEENMVSYYERISERFKGGIKVEPASLAGYR